MKKRLNKDIFIETGKNIHGVKYDYSLVEYINSTSKVKIICPKHGIFEQSYKVHILNKSGCSLCGLEKIKKNNLKDTDYFISNSKKIHGDKYDYSLVKYVNAKSNIKIICSIHGIFEQTPSNHSKGFGCPLCGNKRISEKLSKTQEQWIDDSNIVHNNIYNYDKIIYINARSKVIITCKKHGDFEQIANKHLSGQGCPICNSSKGEREVLKYLNKNNIKYESQFKFKNCKDKLPLPFDFYLPIYNLCIEYDGKQHFEKNDFFGENSFIGTQKHDKLKNNYCLKNNINLLRISSISFNDIEQILDEEIK